MNAISCLTWVKRGVAKSHPDKLRLTETDLRLLQAEASTHVEDENDESEVEEASEEDEESSEEVPQEGDDDNDDDWEDVDDDIDDKYNLDHYDEEEDVRIPEEDAMTLTGLATYGSNQDDPYMDKEANLSDADEDLEIEPDDNLILMGKFQQDYSGMNVYVYNEKTDYLYCHHDSLLLGFPLCMEWLDFDPGEEKPGNMVAIGYMEPSIEIWDVDVLDSLEPAFVLKGHKKSKKKSKKVMSGHSDAVLDLSWNLHHRNVLASASADQTIGLWDLTEGKTVMSLTDHGDKVQAVEWHPVEAETLLSGSFDKVVKIFDCRSPESANKSWSLSGEVEKVLWNAHGPFYFYASSDNGFIYCFDVRSDAPVFKVKAHDEAVCGLSISSSIPGCLVTCSPDQVVKVWDVKSSDPKMVLSKELGLGQLHSLASSPDAPLLFAVGGEREMRVLNLQKHSGVTSHFGVEYIGRKAAQGSDDSDWEIAQSDESENEEEGKVKFREMEPKKKKANSKKAKNKKKKNLGKNLGGTQPVVTQKRKNSSGESPNSDGANAVSKKIKKKKQRLAQDESVGHNAAKVNMAIDKSKEKMKKKKKKKKSE